MAFIIFLNIPLAVCVYYFDGLLLKAGLYFYSAMYLTIAIISSTSFVFGLFVRLRTMADIIKSMVMVKCSSEVTQVHSLASELQERKEVEILIGIYADIVDSYDDVTYCYGLPNMLAYGLLFSHSVFTTFLVYKDISSFRKLSNITIITLLYMIFYHFLLANIICVNSLARREVSSTLK